MEYKCEIKNCRKSRDKYELFTSPLNEKLTAKWRKAIGTNKSTFYVCEHHFSKEDITVSKILKFTAIPKLHLSDEDIKIENKCCGFCLEDFDDYFEIQDEYKEIFSEITGYGPLTDLICNECQQAMIKYKKFQTEIKQNHVHIRKMVCNQNEEDNDDCMVVEQPSTSNSETSSIFKCRYCTRFETKEQFRMFDHIRENHSFQCDQCRFFCARATELGNHVLLHHNERKPLSCAACKITGFLSTAILDIHRETSHNVKNFECPYCPRFFKTAVSLRVHLAFSHSYSDRVNATSLKTNIQVTMPPSKVPVVIGSKVKPLAQKPITQREQNVVKNLEFLNIPYSASTNVDIPITNDPLVIQSTEIKTELEDAEMDDVVKIDAGSIEQIKEEELSSESTISQTEEIDEEFLVEVPDFLDDNEVDEMHDMDVDIKEPLNEPKVIKIEPEKEEEQEKTSEEKPKDGQVKCLDCQKLMHVTELLEHRLKEHSEPEFKEYEAMPEPPFKVRRPYPAKPLKEEICPFCDYEIFARDKVAHLREFHPDKPKPFLCHICSKDFYSPRNLEAHMRWHNPETQFTCDLCGMRYVWKTRIHEHIKRHHLDMNTDTHRCKICLKSSKDPIKYHMKRYHRNGYDCGARANSETNFYDCPKCGASYRDLFTYRRHDCEKGRYQIRCNDCLRPVKNMDNLKHHQQYQCYKTTKRGYLIKYVKE